MVTKRGASNSNHRGSSKDRAARRKWLLETFGNGLTAPCYRCSVELSNETITVRLPIPPEEIEKLK